MNHRRHTAADRRVPIAFATLMLVVALIGSQNVSGPSTSDQIQLAAVAGR